MTEEGSPPVIEERGPFKVVSREIKHDKFGMQLVADKVIRPDGSNGEQFWVNFKNPAVLIFPMDDEKNIYLSDEYTYATNQRSIEVAGGSANDGESLEDAAKREVKSELGLEVDSLLKIAVHNSISSRVNNQSHLFLAKVKSVGEANPDIGEDIKLKKVPFDTAVEMVLDGTIKTPEVAVGILQIKVFLDSLKNPK